MTIHTDMPAKMLASEWNAQFADERVAHIGQPATAPHTKEVWRGWGPYDKDRVTQISGEGQYRTVDTTGLLHGAGLKAVKLKMKLDLHTADIMFPLNKEVW